jgi:hypothetical protein
MSGELLPTAFQAAQYTQFLHFVYILTVYI